MKVFSTADSNVYIVCGINNGRQEINSFVCKSSYKEYWGSEYLDNVAQDILAIVDPNNTYTSITITVEGRDVNEVIYTK